jgi:hypothetical protein
MTTLRLVLAAFAATALAVPASAQPTANQVTAVRNACPADYRAHCASVPPGGQAALSCLMQNLSSLSAACQKAVSAAVGPAPPAGASTAPATQAPATAATPAPAAAPAAPAAAPAAAAPAVPALTPREEIAVLRIGCGPDVRTLCAGTQPGGGRIAACLSAHRADLSPRCVRALSTLRR